MKRRIGILFILLCLFTNVFSVNPIIAEEESSEEIYETVFDDEDVVFEEDEEETIDFEQEGSVSVEEEFLPEEETQLFEDNETEQEGGIIVPDKEETDVITEDFTFTVPEDFVIRAGDFEGKKVLKENEVLERFEELEEGVDYKKGELYFVCDDIEYARQVAEIYHCELISFSDHVALIAVSDEEVTVKDIFMSAVNDPDLPLLAPNYLVKKEPVVEESDHKNTAQSDEYLPEVRDWDGWVNDAFIYPDPFLSYPAYENYQWQHDMIHTYAGWNATMGDPDIRVAVIDDAVNPDHEEFIGRVEVEDVGCGQYYGNGHGNHVAGIIAAEADNGVGGAGIAPGVTLISINVYNNSEWAETADIVEALYRSVDCGANIINMSLGAWGYDWEYKRAIEDAKKAGVVVVAAAGNDASVVKSYPAAFDGVIAVAAVNKSGARASYSNYGSWVTISAPGSDIISPCSTDDDPYDDAYDWMSGTSMATPVVSGVLALYMSKVGPIDYDQAVKVLKTAVNKSSSSQMGFGIIDVEKLFSRIDITPNIVVYDLNDNQITNLLNPVPEGSYFNIETDIGDYADTIIYTTNGKKPTIKNGQIISGEIYNGEDISLDSFEKGTTITINAAVVNSLGVMGSVKKFTIKAPSVKNNPYKIKTVAIDQSKLTMEYSAYTSDVRKIEVTQLVDTNGNSYNLNEVDHIWISSDPKVAQVDEDGYICAKGKGSAKITLKILDGSKKTAVCSVTVLQLAEEIQISGQDAIVPGGSATYKANILPASTNNKKVEWTVAADNAEVKISAAGKLTVPKDITYDELIYVYAKATDSGETLGSKLVRICPMATAVEMITDDDRAIYSKGKLSSAVLFTADLKDDEHPIADNEIRLYGYAVGNDLDVVWSSSNTKVAVVDEDGLVKAVGAGKATITCAANDGSKKKASITINVRVPASSIAIDLGYYYTLTLGKKLNLKDKVSFGSQYGTPTLKKVNWSIDSVKFNVNGTDYDVTDDTKKDIKIVNNSSLSVAKKIDGGNIDPDDSVLYVVLKATAADGTEYTDYTSVRITRNISYFRFEYSRYEDYFNPDYYYEIWFYCDSPTEFDVKSSNAKIATACYGGKDGFWYAVDVQPVKKGTITITVKALDGSNKTAKVKYRFR